MLLSKSGTTRPPLIGLHGIILSGPRRSLRSARRCKPMHLCIGSGGAQTRRILLLMVGAPRWDYLLGMIGTATARTIPLGCRVRRTPCILVLLNVVVAGTTPIVRWWCTWMLRYGGLRSLAGQVGRWVLRRAIIIVSVS